LIDRVKVEGRNSRLVRVYEVFNADEPAMLEGKLANAADFDQALSYYQQQQFDKARPLFEQCLTRCPADPIARIYRNRCDGR
jgi:predicted Zn-dependent protease